MKYAIIAAGEGSRLAQEGLSVPKPLVKVGGEMMIDRLFRIFMDNGATQISVICNDLHPTVMHHLEEVRSNGIYGKAIPMQYIVKTTKSSMHSLYELSRLLDGDFCLTTVDTIFREQDFSDYVRVLGNTLEQGYDGVMGVSSFIDDEKPLYVDVDKDKIITGFYDTPNGCSWISAGIYGLSGQVIKVLNECIAKGESRMRNFQRALIAHEMKLKAYFFSTVFDIDHVADISKADIFLTEN